MSRFSSGSFGRFSLFYRWWNGGFWGWRYRNSGFRCNRLNRFSSRRFGRFCFFYGWSSNLRYWGFRSGSFRSNGFSSRSFKARAPRWRCAGSSR